MNQRQSWWRRLAQIRRGELTHAMLLVIGATLLAAAAASGSHMFVAFSWANDPLSALALTCVVIAFNLMFFCLALIRKDAPPRMVTAIKWAFFLLAACEWWSNMSVAWLLLQERMPAGAGGFIGLPDDVTMRLAAFFLSGIIPLISYASLHALLAGGATVLRDDAPAGTTPPGAFAPEDHAWQTFEQPGPFAPGGLDLDEALAHARWSAAGPHGATQHPPRRAGDGASREGAVAATDRRADR